MAKETQTSLRQRIVTELAASGGLNTSGNTVATEVLLYLPGEFLEAYSALFWDTFRTGDGSVPMSDELGKETVKEGLGSRSGGSRSKTYKEYWTVKSDKLFRLKARIDQQLLELGRDIEGSRERLGGEGKGSGRGGGQLQCSGCKQFLKDSFKYCPSCGTRARK